MKYSFLSGNEPPAQYNWPFEAVANVYEEHGLTKGMLLEALEHFSKSGKLTDPTEYKWTYCINPKLCVVIRAYPGFKTRILTIERQWGKQHRQLEGSEAFYLYVE